MSSIRIGETSAGSVEHSGIAVTSVRTELPAGSLLQFSVETTGRARRERSAENGSRRRTLRRLRGFVVEDRGRELKVAFVPEDGAEDKLVLYYLPADLLRHAGVTAENQQFELDEVVTKFRDGSVAVTYHVRPSAPANEGFVDPLDLDAARRDKLTVLLNKLGHAQV